MGQGLDLFTLWTRTRERDRARSAVDHGTARRRNAAALVTNRIRHERKLISRSERVIVRVALSITEQRGAGSRRRWLPGCNASERGGCVADTRVPYAPRKETRLGLVPGRVSLFSAADSSLRDRARSAVDHGTARRRNAAALVTNRIRHERKLISRSERVIVRVALSITEEPGAGSRRR